MSTPRRPEPRSSAPPITASFRCCTEGKAKSAAAQGALDGHVGARAGAAELRHLGAVDRPLDLGRPPLIGEGPRPHDREGDLHGGRRMRAPAGDAEVSVVLARVLLPLLLED